MDGKYADILFREEVNGKCLVSWDVSDYKDAGIPVGPAKLIIKKIDELKKLKESQDEKLGHSRAYPFNRYNEAHRYRENSDLVVTETGPSDLIEPCHEFKAFNNALTPDEQKEKFMSEIIRFGSACMNSRTNGTIHFGVGDEPTFRHGQILGFVPHNKEAFLTSLSTAIEGNFEHKHIDAAKKCIKTPRFVEVLSPNMTFSNKYVLEVDIKPDNSICKENIYKVKSRKKKAEGEDCWSLYIREEKGTSTVNILAKSNQRKYEAYMANISQLSIGRKEAEDKSLVELKNSVQGSRLCEMLTGGKGSMDKSHYQHYILVANKSHPGQLESLGFLCDMKLTAVLDLDPESTEHGLKTIFEKENTKVHSPTDYEIKDSALDMASKLKLTRTTSWVFCNGSTNSAESEKPSEIDSWMIEKGSAVRDVVSLLCRGDVLPPKKFLVIFMLFSDVTDNKDPLLKIFDMFFEKLRGFQQIICICENKHLYTNWIQLTENSCGNNISSRCISELSFAEVNGTVLSLWSNNRRSRRFLPSGGGSKVELTKKMEGHLDTLDILCANQCEDEELDENAKKQIEENFYRGGMVTWWNFHFCEKPRSVSFIKRDQFHYMVQAIRSSDDTCALFNVVHLPGCGGTTLAMNILWELKKDFRCAVLKYRNSDHSEVANQVMELLSHGTTKESPLLPVLLMIDNFEDKDDVYNLKQSIEDEHSKLDFATRVIILNCMRTEVLGNTESTEDTIFVGNELSVQEQTLFEEKFEEIKKRFSDNENIEMTFYGFMFMKEKFSLDYIERVAKNILKNFDISQKEAQVFAVLTLLDFYTHEASLSISLCEELLGLNTKANSFCTVEDGFGRFSPLVTRCSARGKVDFEAVRVIHSVMAEQCLKELHAQYNISKAHITDLLLTTDAYFECTLGTDKVKQAVHDMLLKRNEGEMFSSLIHAIDKETRPRVEGVLLNSEKRFQKDAVICQLLARYYYLKKKDFSKARKWAKLAKEYDPNNSYIADTFGQVIKQKFWHNIESEGNPVMPEKLREYLEMAQSAMKAFQETQAAAKKEAADRFASKKDNKPFNTAGCLGELQVAVQVLDVLELIPFFSRDQKKLCDFLSKKPLHHIFSNDTLGYYQVLQNFEGFLHNIKSNMKKHIDFFDIFFVILEKRFNQRDSQKERTEEKVLKCFDRYTKLFCQPHAEGHNNMKIRQYLEKHKADTYSGLLHRLSDLTKGDEMENIFKHYQFVLQGHCSPRDKAHLIYTNIVLNCVKPTSDLKLPYSQLLDLLRQILRAQMRQNDSLTVNFLAVMMLWPGQANMNTGNLSDYYESYLTQLKEAFYTEMKPVNIGMWPAVHFFLGKKQGYGSLVCRKELTMCVEPSQTSSVGKTGWIRKNESIKQLLLEVSGRVNRGFVWADTTNPNVKVPVAPFSKSQVSGIEGLRVTFYVGFSMNGPVAFDIKRGI